MTTVGQIIDLIDYNREGDYTVLISEEDEKWNRLYTNSVMLDMISDFEIDSIDADEDTIRIWLTDSSVTEYWSKLNAQAKEERHE